MNPKAILKLLSITLLFATLGNAQVATDSLLLDMSFDGNANDMSGNNNNGIVHGVVLDTNRYGVPNTAFRFNGINSYIEIPASPSLNRIQTANVVTISAWVNIFQWYQNVNVFSIFERYNPATDAGWLFEANWAGGGLLFLADESNGTNWVGCNYTWNFHEWHYMCLTYDQSQGIANFYVDTTLIAAVPYTANIFVSDTTAPFVIGRSLAGPDEYSDGLIDDYKIYNRVLTPAEIHNTFTAGLQANFATSNFSIYPNPVQDIVTIKSKTGNGKPNFYIADVVGKSIIKGQLKNDAMVVDLSELTPGIYWLHVGDEDRSFKIVKQ